MKAFLNFLSSVWFFVTFRFFQILMGKEKMIDELSAYITKSIMDDIKISIDMFENMSNEEVFLMKELLFSFYTQNFRFLEEEEEQIKQIVYKKIDIKINWILANN